MKTKKALMITDFIIILLLLVGLLVLVGIIYFGLSGKLPSLLGSIRNMFRFGN
ncbi:hypothetical protein J4218_00420 [Candidatus Pacearchaeota archaeon]|nr:hypothetical protein [Candidatus Pacearchaeota archaeon]